MIRDTTESFFPTAPYEDRRMGLEDLQSKVGIALDVLTKNSAVHEQAEKSLHELVQRDQEAQQQQIAATRKAAEAVSQLNWSPQQLTGRDELSSAYKICTEDTEKLATLDHELLKLRSLPHDQMRAVKAFIKGQDEALIKSDKEVLEKLRNIRVVRVEEKVVRTERSVLEYAAVAGVAFVAGVVAIKLLGEDS